MKQKSETRTVCLVLSATLMIALAPVITADAADWPQFRGPGRDARAVETGLLTSWPDGGPRELWRAPLGEGFSGLSITGGRLYTMFAEGQDELVGSFEAASGKPVWRFRADDKWRDNFGNGPRSTPTVDGDVVYALSARGKLYALAAADGKVLWKRDLQQEFGAKPPQWGVSTSPLVEGKLLLVDVGGKQGSSIVAFDKKTGEEVWRSNDDKAGYSAPLAVTIDGVRQVLVFSARTLVALSPEDGKIYWKVPWETSYDVNASTPVFVPPDKIFVSTGYDVGSALFRVEIVDGKARTEQIWKNREMRNKFSSSVLHEGHLYGFDEKNLKCIDVLTGKPKWLSRGLGHGSLIYADGHLIVLGDKGTLALVEATAEGYRERGRSQVFEGKTWTMPALAAGRLYLRDEKELVVLDLSDTKGKE